MSKFDFDDYTLICFKTPKEDHGTLEEHTFIAYLREISEATLHEYGKTRNEAVHNLQEQFEFLQDYFNGIGKDLPAPSSNTGKNYSGRVLLRIPKWLHKRMSEQAEVDEMSLNSYVISLLSSYSTIDETRQVTVDFIKKSLTKGHFEREESTYNVNINIEANEPQSKNENLTLLNFSKASNIDYNEKRSA